MGLSSYRPVTARIEIDGDSAFHVKGLSYNDLVTLLTQYKPDMEVLAVEFTAAGQDLLETEHVGRFLGQAMEKAPHIVATIIALADYDEADTITVLSRLERSARMLPFPTQTEALLKIAELTFREAGGPRKFMATLMRLIAGLLPPGTVAQVQASLGTLTQNSTASSGASALN